MREYANTALGKIIKRGLNYPRLICLKIKYGNAIQVRIYCKRPAYIGKDCRVKISGTEKIILAEGVYLDDYCTLDVCGGLIEIKIATLTLSAELSPGENHNWKTVHLWV